MPPADTAALPVRQHEATADKVADPAGAAAPPERQQEATAGAAAPPARQHVATVDTAALPVRQHEAAVLAAVRGAAVSIIIGETGSGKTTQLPQMLLDAPGLLPDGAAVAVTQPRRVAAIAVARRVAQVCFAVLPCRAVLRRRVAQVCRVVLPCRRQQ